MPKVLGNNPLMKKDPVLTEDDVSQIMSERASQQYQAMTFKVKKTYLEKLRAYAYTNRLEIKEALEQALSMLLDPIDDNDLLTPPKKR